MKITLFVFELVHRVSKARSRVFCGNTIACLLFLAKNV